jgi:flagellar protein FliL
MSSQPAPAPAGDAAAPAEAAKKGGGSSMLPAILALVGAPVITWAVAQFVLVPQLRKELAAGGAAEAHEAAPAAVEGGHGKEAGGHGAKGGKGEAAAGNGFTFENVVVNLAGTMGTRYLKTTFLVTGTDAALKSTFEENRAALVDVTLNVLSSLTLSDLEEAGSKNLIREKLVQSYNQQLGHKVAEQVFFSDFVVQ